MAADLLGITSSKCKSCPIQDFFPDKQLESEKFLKTPSSVIGLPEYKLPDYLDVVSFSDPIMSDTFRLIDTNSKIGGVLFVDDILESDKVVEIMTADKYKELREKIEKYESFDKSLKEVIRLREGCKSGISLIRPFRCTTAEDVFCNDKIMGDGFQELVTQKVIEAFDEQIRRIEKQMEEL